MRPGPTAGNTHRPSRAPNSSQPDRPQARTGRVQNRRAAAQSSVPGSSDFRGEWERALVGPSGAGESLDPAASGAADPKRRVRFFDELVRRRRASGLYEAGLADRETYPLPIAPKFGIMGRLKAQTPLRAPERAAVIIGGVPVLGGAGR